MLKRDKKGVKMKLVTMSIVLSALLYAGGDILPVETITQFEKMDTVSNESTYVENNYVDGSSDENVYVEQSSIDNSNAEEPVYIDETSSISDNVMEENSYSDESYVDESNADSSSLEQTTVEGSYISDENMEHNYVESTTIDNEESYPVEESSVNDYTSGMNIENSDVNEGNYVLEKEEFDNSFTSIVIDNCVTTCGVVAEILPYNGEDIPDAFTEPCLA